MDESTTPTPAPAPKRTLLQRIWATLGNAWEFGRTKLFEWRHTGNHSAAKALAVLLVVLAALWAVHALWPSPSAPVAAPAHEVSDSVADLVIRIEVLEEETSRLAGLAHRPHNWTPKPSAQRAPADKPATDSPPPVPATAWGTTDLDREIAAFPSTSLEQSK